MKTIALVNRKGGVGKTAVATCLAHHLAQRAVTCLIDLDWQSHCAWALGVQKIDEAAAAARIFTGEAPQAMEVKGIRLFPATPELQVLKWKLIQAPRRDERLAHFLQTARADFAVVDTPADFDIFTQNAVNAADLVLVPSPPEGYPTVTMRWTWEVLQEAKAYRPGITAKIVLTMFQERAASHRALKEHFEKSYPEALLKTVIPRSVFFQDAGLEGKLVTEYNRDHKLVEAFRALGDEVQTLLDGKPR